MTEQETMHGRHVWSGHRLAAQMVRAWVRETQAQLPAWTPPEVATAYVGMLAAVQHLVEATRKAERQEGRHA